MAALWIRQLAQLERPELLKPRNHPLGSTPVIERIEALLLANYKLTRAQLDAMWSDVGNKGEKGAMSKPMIVALSGAA